MQIFDHRPTSPLTNRLTHIGRLAADIGLDGRRRAAADAAWRAGLERRSRGRVARLRAAWRGGAMIYWIVISIVLLTVVVFTLAYWPLVASTNERR